MNMARLEMGSDAMLVTSHRTDVQARHLGEYEVVFASTSYQNIRSLAAGLETSTQVLPPKGPLIDKLSDDVAGLKHEMERLTSALARSTGGMVRIAANPGLAEAFSRLVDAELDADLAQDILSRVISKAGGTVSIEPACVSSLIASEIASLCTVDCRLGESGRNAIAIVGPPGSGKTTTLVKLAVLYGLGTRRSSQILSMDAQRVAASEQLRSYAAIAGLGFQALGTPRALVQALEEHRSKELIFIDTPGFGPHDLDDASGLADVIAGNPVMDTYLVLNACMKSADLRRAARLYEVFSPSKLVFTHIDETETFGPLLSLSVKTGKPISFLARGQQVPEDLEPAGRRALAELVIGDVVSAVGEVTSIAAA